MSDSSKPRRKPNSNSRLKTLPEDVQARIADWCAQDSLESAVSRCASELQPPVKTNRDSMSKFFKGYQLDQAVTARKETLRELFHRADVNTQTVGTMLKETGASEDQIARAEQLVFTLQASALEDKELFLELERLRITRESAAHKAKMDLLKIEEKRADRALAERRLILLEEREQSAKKVLGNTKLSAAEKEQRIKEVFGITA